jgi:hypothetical protein
MKLSQKKLIRNVLNYMLNLTTPGLTLTIIFVSSIMQIACSSVLTGLDHVVRFKAVAASGN